MMPREIAEESAMSTKNRSKNPSATKNTNGISRRELLRGGATLGAAGALMAGCTPANTPPERLSEAN